MANRAVIKELAQYLSVPVEEVILTLSIRERLLNAELTIKSMLDYGCGIGSAGLNLAPALSPDVVIDFMEPNQYARKFLTWRIPRLLKQTHVRVQSYIRPYFPYDLIIAWGVFEHIPDGHACILFHKLLGCLSPGGKLFLKNFYTQTDKYLQHFPLGPEMQKNYEQYKERIIYARHSDQ